MSQRPPHARHRPGPRRFTPSGALPGSRESHRYDVCAMKRMARLDFARDVYLRSLSDGTVSIRRHGQTHNVSASTLESLLRFLWMDGEAKSLAELDGLASDLRSQGFLLEEDERDQNGTDHSRDAESMPICIGKYRLLSHLGAGASGSVFRAYDSASGEDVALKILLRQNREDVADLKKELRILADLHHASLVIPYELSESNNC